MATLNPLIPFNMVIDTDVGLIKLIDKKYHNKDVFYSAMLSAPIKPLIYNLINRPVKNPLYIVMKDSGDTETMDLLYDQFMEEEYKNIIANSVTTDIFSAIKLFMKTDSVIPNILCKNEFEADTISKIDLDGKNIATVIGTLKDNQDLFDPLYVKDFNDILPIVNDLKGKNVYVADYPFNYENYNGNKVLLRSLSVAISNSNVVKTTQMYNIDDSFIAKG